VQSFREVEAFTQAEEFRAQEQYDGLKQTNDINNQFDSDNLLQAVTNFAAKINDSDSQFLQYSTDQSNNILNVISPPANWNTNPVVKQSDIQETFQIMQQTFQNTIGSFKANDYQSSLNFSQENQYQHNDNTFNQPPAAFMPPVKHFDVGYDQPPAAYAPPVQNFDGGYNQPMYYQPPAAYAPPVQNFDGGYNQPMYYQPPAAYAPPVQNFDGGYNQPMYYQPPAAYAPPVQNFDGGYNQPMYYQPPTATGFAPMPPMDASGFPIATSGANVFNAKSSFSSGPDFADVSSVNANLDTLQFESFEAEDSIQQFPQQ
jgi:hypothetical protein